MTTIQALRPPWDANMHARWRANPHQFGLGKVHLLADQESTMCGREKAQIPGRFAAQYTFQFDDVCQRCLKAVEVSERNARWEADRAEREQTKAEQDREWWARYNTYLNSSAWKTLRERVMRRVAGRCEGCGLNEAVHVHHLTYEHVGQEFLWELRAVCGDCHHRLHPNKL